MATTFTLATFNAENMFRRFKFKGKKVAAKKGAGKAKAVYRPYTAKEIMNAVKDGFIIDKTLFETFFPIGRKLTAKAIAKTGADFIALQEIENLDTLKTFNHQIMTGKGQYKYELLIDGNDNRLIDVGCLSNAEIDFVRTHQYDVKPGGRGLIFSRDCLEVHVKVGHTVLPIFINHLKSMIGGRPQTKPRREEQCRRIVEILKERFGSDYGDSYFAVVGDFNDYLETGKSNESGLRELLTDPMLVNVIDRLPADQRWTHYYQGSKEYRQLDYILLSRRLADDNPNAAPVIVRGGMPKRVNQAGQPPRVNPKDFFAGVTDTAKASDHCPVAITLRLP